MTILPEKDINCKRQPEPNFNIDEIDLALNASQYLKFIRSNKKYFYGHCFNNHYYIKFLRDKKGTYKKKPKIK